MYAVIRTGGKQYLVSPGEQLKIETTAANENGTVEFSDILAVSGEEGVVFAAAYVEAGLELGAALTDDDAAAEDGLAAEDLDAEPLGV